MDALGGARRVVEADADEGLHGAAVHSPRGRALRVADLNEEGVRARVRRVVRYLSTAGRKYGNFNDNLK